MPIVRAPDGKLVRFPDEMPNQEIRARIAAAYPGAYDKPEPAIGDIFASALARGGINLEATLKDELPAYLASIIGQDEYAKEQLAEAEQRRAAAEEQYPTQYGSFEDVESIGDVGGFITEKFAENLPQIGGVVIPSAIAGAVAAPFVGLGVAAGSTATGLLGSFSLMAPETFSGIYEKTGKLEPVAATIAGAVNSALELVAPVQLLRSFSPSMRSAVVAAALKKSGMAPTLAVNAAKGVVKGAATEGLTEGAQESVNIAAENFVSENPEIFTEENISRVLESAVAGAAVGVPLGGVGGVGRGLTRRAEARRLEEEQAAAQLPEEVAIEEPVVAEQPAPEAPATVIPTDKAALNKWGMAMLGIAPNAKIIRPDGPLAGKDLTDPAQAVEVKTALEEYLKTAKNEKIINKVKAVIRDLEPTGTFAAEPTAVPAAPAAPVLDEDIPEPVVVKKEAAKPVAPEVAEEPAIDEELATRGFQKAEAQDETIVGEDIPEDRPLWSKDLLGFLTDEYEFTEAELAQVQNFSEPEMRDFLAEVEARDNLVFDGPLVEEEMIVPQEPPVAQPVETAVAPEDDGVGRVKDLEQAKIVFEELGVNEEESFNLTDEGFDTLVRTAQAQRAEKTAAPKEKTLEELFAERDETFAKQRAELDARKEQLNKEAQERAQIELDKIRAAAPQDKPAAKKAAKSRIDEIARAAKKKPPAVKKFGEDKLAFRDKPMPNKAYQELAALKAATSPQEEATDGRQVLANYLHAYSTPEGAIAAIAAESNVDYTEIENKKLAATVVDAQKAGAYINKNMDESVKDAFKKNVDFVTKELASVERRNAKQKTNAEISKISDLGRSKTEKELSKAVNKDALKVDRKLKRKKKKLVGETPEQIAKRIDKERRDAEAESLAEFSLEAEQEGTLGYVAAIIKNAQGIAEKTEEELGPQSRSNEWVKFIASLPKTKQKTFLDSYTRISKENPNLIPESVRARVVAENKKILSQKDQKRLVKFEEKFLLKTPKYQGPELNPFVELFLANNDLQTALDMVVDDRIARDADKNITALISKIRSKVVGTKVALDGPGIKATNLDPLRSEALEVQAGVEGKSAVEAAKFIAKNAPTKDMQVLAAAIQNKLSAYEKAGMPVDFKVIHLGDSIRADMQSARGFQQTQIKRDKGKPVTVALSVRVNGADVTGKVGTSYEVVTHELFHAVTALQIYNVGELNDARTNQATADLRDVANFVIEQFNAKIRNKEKLLPIEEAIAKSQNNFLDNTREFVTWAMTNPGASEYLESIPYKKGNAFTAFVRAIRKMIGLPDSADSNTALSETIRITEVLLGKKAVAAAMRKVQAVEGAGIAATTLPNMASGAYIPGLNTIVLSTRTGLNEHTLLHESGHAALAQILNNRDHPITKKFIAFFEEVKTRVGEAYGGSDIQEFAAEFVGNGEFQALLKQIKSPKGDSLWTRIIQTIAEFFGLRKADTAYDTTLKFLNDLLDVSQGIEPTLADTLYLGNGDVNQVLNEVSDNIASRNIDAALDKLSEVKDDKARIWALGSASLSNQQNMFGETSPRYKNKNPLPIGRLLRAIEKKRGEVNKEIDNTSKNIRSMTKAEREATPAQRIAFNDLAIDGRLLGIDIFKPAPKGTKARADYQKLMNRYKNLPKGLQETYKTLREDLDRYLKEYVELINEVLPSTAASNLLKDFATLEGVAAYVPFGRDGEYWFRYKDPENLDSEGNPKITASAATSPRKREMAVAALKAKHGANFEVEIFDNISSMRVPKGLPEGQFVTKLVGELRNNNVDEKIVEQIYQQYVSMFPENSIIQQFKKSKNVPGMDRDVITGYSNVAIKWANKIANTRYNPEIETAISEIVRVAKEYHGGDKNIMAAAKGLQMQEDFFLNPRVSPWASSLTFASYFEYILGSVSSAVVNLTGLVFMVTPMLGARTTYPKALSALQAAGVTATQDWGTTAKYKKMHDELDSRGLLKHTLAREALERGKTKGKDFNGLFYRTVDFLSTPFAASERYMRSATAIAAYDLAMANGIPSEGVPANNQMAAIDFAAKMVRDAHTGGMAETMPRWMQNDFGRVVWTFKNIVFQQAYVLGTAMKQAFIDSDLPPEVKRAAMRQVLGTYGLSFALLGVKGMPFFGATTALMRFIEFLIPDDDEEPYDPKVQLNET